MSAALRGKTIVITGASSGLGRSAAGRLAERGAHVAVVGRDPERTRAVAESVGGRAFLADFADFAEVRDLAARLLESYDGIDVLANNAGGLVSKRTITPDGHEQTIQVNHLSPFLLTGLLLPRLLGTASADRPVRVISTGSVANNWGRLKLDDLDWAQRRWNGGWRAYGTAKLAVLLFTRELARRTGGTQLSAYAFHPGFVATGFGADSVLMKAAALLGNGGFGLTPEAGAVPLVELASSPDLDAPSGTYFDQLTPDGRRNAMATDDEAARLLWELSERLTGVSAATR